MTTREEIQAGIQWGKRLLEHGGQIVIKDYDAQLSALVHAAEQADKRGDIINAVLSERSDVVVERDQLRADVTYLELAVEKLAGALEYAEIIVENLLPSVDVLPIKQSLTEYRKETNLTGERR